MARHILPLIPQHTLYCEPFFGGGAVFFAKEPSEIEVINDLNGDLINFYQVLKRRFKALMEEVTATLHSRELHAAAGVVQAFPKLFNEVKRAWAIWVLANGSYASKLNTSWGYDRKRNTSAKRLNYKRVEFSKEFADRLRNTEMENAEALWVIESRDGKDSFFYCDPPYFNSDKGHYMKYSSSDFEALLTCLSRIKGKFILSAYPSKLLSRYIRIHHWYFKAISMHEDISTKYKSSKRKTEILTANFPIH